MSLCFATASLDGRYNRVLGACDVDALTIEFTMIVIVILMIKDDGDDDDDDGDDDDDDGD